MPNYLTCFSRQAAQPQGQRPGASQDCLSVHPLRTSAGKCSANDSTQCFSDHEYNVCILVLHSDRVALASALCWPWITYTGLIFFVVVLVNFFI